MSSTEYRSGKLIETGIASWYGPKFHGRETANGEIFDQRKLTAAHRTLPFGSIVKVVNKSNGRNVTVRINDRGPYAKNRIIDLSKKAAEVINMIGAGYTEVDLILLNRKQLPMDLKIPHYTVQIGSYINKKDAVKFSSGMSDTRIAEAIVNGTKYYRVYAGLFKQIEDARKLKTELKSKGVDGFVKQVEN